MSQRFVAKKRLDSHVSNVDMLRKSIIELREIYSEMSDTEYAVMYERRYGVKMKEVKRILRGAENESSL